MNDEMPVVPRRIRESWDKTILVTSKKLLENYGILRQNGDGGNG